MVGASGCGEDLRTTVSPELGKENAALDQKYNDQIAALKQKAETQTAQLDSVKKIVASAGGSVHGVLVAAQHVEDGLPKDAINSEGKLAADKLATVVPADPAASLEAEQRVNLILTNQLELARKAYSDENAKVIQAKSEIAARDAEIAKRDAEIVKRDADLVAAKKAAEAERVATAKVTQDRFDAYEQAIQALKNEQAAKERRMWLNVLRFGGFGFCALGIILIALTSGEAWKQGGLLILGGASVIGIGLGFDILTSQKWFPWAFGLVALLVVGGIGWGLWHLWQNNKLYQKTTAAIQDIKDEANVVGSSTKDAWDKLAEHLQYRVGAGDSFWGKVVSSRLVARGLNSDTQVTPSVPPPTPPTT